MHPRRLTRLNELIQQTVSQSILNLKDPGLGFITITGSEISPDVSLAKIFYSVLGTEDEQKATAEALERAKSHIRHELGRLENLRRVPALMFVFDHSAERADRVSRILKTIENERTDRPKDSR